jgi:hypothetical protein
MMRMMALVMVIMGVAAAVTARALIVTQYIAQCGRTWT